MTKLIIPLMGREAEYIQAFIQGEPFEGALLLERGGEFELVELPGLDGALVVEDAPPSKVRREENKRQVYAKLCRYRREQGLGCLDRLAGACGKDVTSDILRSALAGMPLPLERWRSIGAALEAAGYTEG